MDALLTNLIDVLMVPVKLSKDLLQLKKVVNHLFSVLNSLHTDVLMDLV